MTLALETVIAWIVLIVVALVVISLMLFFSEDIRRYIERWFGGNKEPEAEVVEAASFPTSQVMAYIGSCWEKTGDAFHEDAVCYILKGDVSGVDSALLLTAVETPARVDIADFDPSKSTTIIRFEDVGNVIKVES